MTSLLIACATCASNFQDDGTNPAGWSILFLLGVILAVLSGVAFTMFRLIRRSDRKMEEAEA
jgi:hypothetical protein